MRKCCTFIAVYGSVVGVDFLRNVLLSWVKVRIMKQVNLYIRAHQVRNLENVRIKYIGCLLLEYKGKRKYVFIDNVGERDQRASMLRLVCSGLKMLKEPCEILVLTLNDIEKKWKKYNDLWNEVNERVVAGGHDLSFKVCKNSDQDIGEVFKIFKSELDRYKRSYKNRLKLHLMHRK